MKKTVKLMALALAAVMMISFCSCSDKNSKKKSSEKGTDIETETSEKPETKKETTTQEETTTQADSADAVYDQIFNLMSGVIGKDQAAAEKMIGDFFGVELEDLLGGIMTDERNGIVTVVHVYNKLLVKDSVRFNEMEIWTDKEDGRVRRVEFILVNNAYNAYKIDDTPEFREEIKKQYSGVKDRLQLSYGKEIKTGNPIYDEDSFFFIYQVSDECFAYVEIRDFTEEGGNGLLKMNIVYADVQDLLDA